MKKYYKYYLKSENEKEMQDVLSDYNINPLNKSETLFEEEIEMGIDEFGNVIKEKRKIYVSVIGSLPLRDGNGEYIMDKQHHRIMDGKFHVNIKSSHKLENLSNKVNPENPERMFA